MIPFLFCSLQYVADFWVWKIMCHTKIENHSPCEKRSASVLSRYGQVGLTMYCNTLSNQLSHTERVRIPSVFRKENGPFLVRHWSCAYSIRNFVRISYTHSLFWDTTLSYYNCMILSKNGKSFIPISHKKLFMKIVRAPHTKFERDCFRCTYYKEQNKKRIMTIVWKTKKLFSHEMSEKCPINSKILV